MKLLFNKKIATVPQGKIEIKATLGFLDGDFNYTNLEPDIKLATPYLIDLVGQDVYDKIEAYYVNNDSVADETEAEKHQTALEYMQLYILSMAYLDYAPDNDLNHGNGGRSFRSEDNEKIPWDWQVQNSNASIKKRAYKALDLLMLLLDGSGWAEWTDSDQYKTANSVLIKNTKEFDAVFPINKSGQLYYRLVPFMADFEQEHLYSIFTEDTYKTLKDKADPSDAEKRLLVLSKKAIAYLSLGKALKTFPVEMFPDGLVYQENTRMKSTARAEVMEFLNNEGNKYLSKLQYELDNQNQTYEAIDPTFGLDANSKHVHL